MPKFLEVQTEEELDLFFQMVAEDATWEEICAEVMTMRTPTEPKTEA